MVRQSNACFGLQAGSPNFAQGGSGNRWRYDDELIRQSRGELFGEPMMEVLPTFAPYKWAFGGDTMQPQDAIAAGAGESLERDLWGGFYYGYHPYAEHGYPAAFDDASYTSMAIGYTDPLFDPDQDMWHYVAPIDSQPQVHEHNPYHAAIARAIGRGRTTHAARSRAGYGYPSTHETLDFHGHSG
jgi:hypothetical protein